MHPSESQLAAVPAIVCVKNGALRLDFNRNAPTVFFHRRLGRCWNVCNFVEYDRFTVAVSPAVQGGLCRRRENPDVAQFPLLNLTAEVGNMYTRILILTTIISPGGRLCLLKTTKPGRGLRTLRRKTWNSPQRTVAADFRNAPCRSRKEKTRQCNLLRRVLARLGLRRSAAARKQLLQRTPWRTISSA